MGLLDEMARSSRIRADRALALRPRVAWREVALAAPTPPRLRLGAFDVIAECKRRSPAEGALSAEPIEGLVARARAYAGGGACAISVLTEPDRFDGDLDHLAAVAPAVPVPAMRKDFLVDPVQLDEARLAGAGGALLIARMLDDRALAELLDAAAELGLFVLVECFDAEDCARTARAVVGRREVLVGVNTRDLRTLGVDPGRLAALVPHLPQGVPWVAESGLHTPEDVEAAARLGYRVALVGTALMRSADPAAAVAALREAGARCS